MHPEIFGYISAREIKPIPSATKRVQERVYAVKDRTEHQLISLVT